MEVPRVLRSEYPITLREIGPFDAECSSVGMVVRASTGRILLLDRLKGIYGYKGSTPYDDFDPSLGWACPAGHIEEGEHPFLAGLRELREETNITGLKRAEMVLELWMSNPCGKAKNHHWYIMQIEVDQELGVVMEPTKHRMLTWAKPDDAMHLDLEAAWRVILRHMRMKGML